MYDNEFVYISDLNVHSIYAISFIPLNLSSKWNHDFVNTEFYVLHKQKWFFLIFYLKMKVD